LKYEEEEIHETLKSVEQQILDFRNRRNELQQKLLHKLSEFDRISINADKPAINGGLEITAELQRSKAKNTMAFENKVKNAIANYKKKQKIENKVINAIANPKKNIRYLRNKPHQEKLQNDINTIVRKNIEKIYLDTAQNVIEKLKPKLEEAQKKFIDDVQTQIELASDRYNLSYKFKIDAFNRLLEEDDFLIGAFGGLIFSSSVASLVGASWLVLALFSSSVGIPPLWPFAAAIAGTSLFAAFSTIDSYSSPGVLKKFNESFNHSYTDRKIKHAPLKEFLKTEILKNIVNKNIQKIKQINKDQVKELLDKIDKNLEIKLYEKQKGQKNRDIVKQNQAVLLKEIETIKSDFDRLKSSSLFA
jgi:hypothetical protein